MKLQIITTSNERDQFILIAETELDKLLVNNMDTDTHYEAYKRESFTERQNGWSIMAVDEDKEIAFRPIENHSIKILRDLIVDMKIFLGAKNKKERDEAIKGAKRNFETAEKYLLNR